MTSPPFSDDPARSLDLPFLAQEPVPMTDDPMLASGVVLGAAYFADDDGTKRPVIIFRFAKPDNTGFYPPIALCAAEDQLLKLSGLISDTVNGAITAARG